ncbi:MAG: GlsB/YeaQ/YmgE family stress response membrane protein [Prevotella sp.]|jgi:uncharacterized membrane protein YeaQ/YmgE (transglycosylase-associated protein family)|nr:GlsB/YeaQ/YmgE family stress response membrane protein [Prevotella sp.]MCI1282091.1 GlsB/YeaQ/YmgE family stress response membrane protein [Prevotella sp.]
MIWTIIIGILAGFIASRLFKHEGSGCLIDLVLGLIGGWLGGNILSWIGISWGGTVLGQICTAVVGAVLLLWVFSLFKK